MHMQRLMAIAWPAFLMAGLLEVLVFALVDPQDLRWFGQLPALSRQGVYTLAFFAFWAITTAGGALTMLLAPAGVKSGAQADDDARNPSSCG